MKKNLNFVLKHKITGLEERRMSFFFYYLQFHCIVWDSSRNVSMNLTFYFYPTSTELGTLTNFLAANVTLTWFYET